MTTYVMRANRDGVVAEASIEITSDQRFADFTIVIDRRRPGGRWQRVAELEGPMGPCWPLWSSLAECLPAPSSALHTRH